jgi:hypothetical protein
VQQRPGRGRLASVSAAPLVLLAMLATPTVAGATSMNLVGSYSFAVQLPAWEGACPSAVADECEIIHLAGYGPAEFRYSYGPLFEPTGTKGCFYVDGTIVLVLVSDGSQISGPSSGVFCRPGDSAYQRATPAYGNPKGETDQITFDNGTGQFAGLTGTAAYSEWSAGARFFGTLAGSLGAP